MPPSAEASSPELRDTLRLTSPESESGSPSILAHFFDPAITSSIVPAERDRDWISQTDHRFAKRCLPLMLANQSGWWILNRSSFRAVWNGRNGRDDLVLSTAAGAEPGWAESHFGYGVITFSIPVLFRTPPGYDLLVRGPANLPKDGVQALEGLVEADWSAATFTMNWKMTRAFEPIQFDVGEPICMIVPQRRTELEEFAPRLLALSDDAGLQGRHQSWSDSRAGFLREQPGSDSYAGQLHYFRGEDVDGAKHVDDHRLRRSLRPFTPDPTETETETETGGH
ncbi:DUF6065 family protein [Kineosporia sp. NBRC 101731]|uniref:DUF6065 family protein n=1 Tax=Kineosporia sp. NBRC 101731 TaxID=3032199 RepID=UPI0024A4DB33|nr:DUF6065 family protein [Kineosporia sp. NBRC 101731]GLY29861.1 hypothetical protein Kisp02_32260 [Kineosporia sp. NBRC 101731]